MRYSHGIAYDPVHDEFFASEPVSSAIVVFRGGADGEEDPIRIIQGPKTRMHEPWQIAVDVKHNELFVADFANGDILVYPLNANGNAAPMRIINARKWGMYYSSGVAVDPESNVIAVGTRVRLEPQHHEPGGLFIFNRTDSGEVKPRGIIAGPRTGMRGVWHVALYGGHIFATVPNTAWKPVYDYGGFACFPGVTKPAPWVWSHTLGFLGVWRETDNGDLPPRGIIRGADSGLYAPYGIILNPELGELTITDQHNQIYTFQAPQLFVPNL